MSYNELPKDISAAEVNILYYYLTGEKREYIRNFVTNNTITVEFPSWQIPFYSSADIDKTIVALQGRQRIA